MVAVGRNIWEGVEGADWTQTQVALDALSQSRKIGQVSGEIVCVDAERKIGCWREDERRTWRRGERRGRWRRVGSIVGVECDGWIECSARVWQKSEIRWTRAFHCRRRHRQCLRLRPCFRRRSPSLSSTVSS